MKILEPIYVGPSSRIGKVLSRMRKGVVHMAIVSKDAKELAESAEIVSKSLLPNLSTNPTETEEGPDLGGFTDRFSNLETEGIITMENCIESLINMSILDEKDGVN